MLALSQQCGKSFHRRKPSADANWKDGLEKVLEDPVGRENFTEFLKREFSAENIMFWMLCEHYRNQTDKQVRKKLAKEIVEHHLCPGASEPINIDSHTRQTTIEGARAAEPDLFVAAQKQIFNLMKFDCYQRFLKSDLCEITDELQKAKALQEIDSKSPKKNNRSRSKSRDRNRLLKATKLNLITLNRENSENQNSCGNSTSDENSPKDEAEEKKRKSLLPWPRGRGKSSETERSNSRSPVLRVRTSNLRRSKRKTIEKKNITNPDLSRSSSKTPTMDNPDISESFTNKILLDDATDVPSGFCRVNLPDLSSAVLSSKTEETLGEVIRGLLEKRGLPEMAVEAHLKETMQRIRLDTKFSNAGGKEIIVEWKTVIRLELPTRKQIAVKADPKKRCFDVLEPVLRKYGLDIWDVALQLGNTDVPVNLNGPISAADKCKLIVRKKDSSKGTKIQPNSFVCEPRQRENSERNVTSLLFEELIKGKELHAFDELGIFDLENNKQVNSLTPNGVALTDEVLRRNSSSLNREKPVSLLRYSNRSSSVYETNDVNVSTSEKTNGQVKSTSGSSLPRNLGHRDSCDISKVWNRVQKRLDDQRGTELNCELPEFLRIKKDSISVPNTVPVPRNS